MKISIIGRTEILFDTAILLSEYNHDIVQIVTSKEAPEYTKTSNDFKALARELDIPFLYSNNLKNNISAFENIKTDIGISMNYTSIIPNSIIEFFKFGILNAHGGDLPKYRGNACQAWAILNGEDKIGLCLHQMEGGKLDSGDILLRDYMPIDINTKVTDAWKWMSEIVPRMFLDAVEKLEQDTVIYERQSLEPQNILRCYPRRPEDGEIDWSKSAKDVLRLINASNHPYSGAFCKFKNNKMIIWDAELIEREEDFLAIPGQVTKIGKNFVDIACGKEKLRLKEAEINSNVNSPEYWIKSLRSRLK